MMVGYHNYWLVLLSVIVSITASYVALEAVSRVTEQRQRTAGWSWLSGASAALGTGIWSMHFIGMLGFELPMPISYDVPRTLVSLDRHPVCLAVIRVGERARCAFWRFPDRRRAGRCGIAAMHYVGMAAMKMEPPIRYDPVLFALSILIAVSASIAALWCAFSLRMEYLFSVFWKKAGSAVIMGTAIYGMHYTGMAAAEFAPAALAPSSSRNSTVCRSQLRSGHSRCCFCWRL
jgi:diguanylate cyclase